MAKREGRNYGDPITPQRFKTLIMQYFAQENQGHPRNEWTESNLRLYLNVTKQQWKDYANDPDYSLYVQYAEEQLEDNCVRRMGESKNATPFIFWLKNHGWSDEKGVKQTVEVGGKLEEVLKGIKLKA